MIDSKSLERDVLNLPLDAARLREMNRLVAKVRKASETDPKLEWLKPFLHPRALRAGTRIFAQGDEAGEAFVLVEGQVVIPEKSVAIEPGTIFGEMALFTVSGRRTASAVCAGDVRLLAMTSEQFEQLYFQNAEFGSTWCASSCAASTRRIVQDRLRPHEIERAGSSSRRAFRSGHIFGRVDIGGLPRW